MKKEKKDRKKERERKERKASTRHEAQSTSICVLNRIDPCSRCSCHCHCCSSSSCSSCCRSCTVAVCLLCLLCVLLCANLLRLRVKGKACCRERRNVLCVVMNSVDYGTLLRVSTLVCWYAFRILFFEVF